MKLSSVFVAALAQVALAIPLDNSVDSCNPLPKGLTASDCAYLQKLRFAGTGANAVSASTNNKANDVWIGNNGPYTLTFKAKAGKPMVLVVWTARQLYGGSLRTGSPWVTYSLSDNQSVMVSIAQNAAGAFAALYNHTTPLNEGKGQIANTWGEFTAYQGQATVDVNREVNMSGNYMSIVTQGGCRSAFGKNEDVCDFTCKNGAKTCGDDAFSYQLSNCAQGSQPGAYSGYDSQGYPTGGCGGWKSAQVTFS